MGKRGPKKGQSGAGRPKKVLTDEHIRQVEAMAGLGLPLREICIVLGISERVLRQRKSEEKKLSAAWERGKAKDHVFTAGKLREQVSAGNLNATMFSLRAKHKWRDDKEGEKSETKSAPTKIVFEIDTKDMSVAEKSTDDANGDDDGE